MKDVPESFAWCEGREGLRAGAAILIQVVSILRLMGVGVRTRRRDEAKGGGRRYIQRRDEVDCAT